MRTAAALRAVPVCRQTGPALPAMGPSTMQAHQPCGDACTGSIRSIIGDEPAANTAEICGRRRALRREACGGVRNQRRQQRRERLGGWDVAHARHMNDM